MSTDPTPPRRQWNVVAATSVLLSVIWVGGALAALYLGKASFSEVAAAIGPVVGIWATSLQKVIE